MRRRNLIAGLVTSVGGAGFAAAGGAWAQVPGKSSAGAAAAESVRPYLQIKPVEGEAAVVRVFFSPSCNFSRMYFQFFKNLQATLPAGWRLAFSPLINKGDGVAYALAFEAVARSYPAYVSNFVEASILGVQDRGMGPSNWKAIERFGQAARLPVSLPILVSANQAQARAAVNAAIDRQRLLGVTNTPAVAVAGTYVATPEFTSGDATMFSELVNGLISMAS